VQQTSTRYTQDGSVGIDLGTIVGSIVTRNTLPSESCLHRLKSVEIIIRIVWKSKKKMDRSGSNQQMRGAELLLRPHRGLRQWSRPLSKETYDILIGLARSRKCWRKGATIEEGFDIHPLQFDCATYVRELLLRSVLNNTTFADEFPDHGKMTRVVCHKFTQGGAGMQCHRDGSDACDGSPVLTLVITICDEMCTGGTIDLSNRDDGTMKYTQHGFALEAKDNTCYAFYGSHVAHIVRPLKRGVRYSFVMFFETTRTPTDIAIDWKLQPRKRKPDEAASPERLICRVCTKAYANAKSLRKHRCKPAEHMLLYRGIGS
jgi:NAD-dependent dihydropyrimidine dehydrogenase PreA subunit